MSTDVMCVHEYALKAIEADLTDALTNPASPDMRTGLFEAARIVSVDKASARRLASGRKRLQEISNTDLNSRGCPDAQQVRQSLAKTADEVFKLFVSILRDLRKHDRQGTDEFGGEPAHPIWAENDELIDGFVESLRQLQDVAGKIIIHVIGGGDELADLVGDVADVSQGERRVADVTPVVGKHFEDQQIGVEDEGSSIGPSCGTNVTAEDGDSHVVDDLEVLVAGHTVAHLDEPAEGFEVGVDPRCPLDGPGVDESSSWLRGLPFLQPVIEKLSRIFHGDSLSHSNDRQGGSA